MMEKKKGDAVPSRRRHLYYLIFFVVALAALVWPGLAVVSGPRPLVFGLPLPLAWIVGWLVLLFLVLIRLYLSDLREGRDQ